MIKQTKMWLTKEHGKIRICDMGDSHLVNTIRMLERVAETTLQRTIIAFASSGGPSGEMAQMCFDNELDNMMQDPDAFEQFLPDIYWNMLDDVERRGLTWASFEDLGEAVREHEES